MWQHRPLAISPKSRKNKRKSSRQLTDFEKTEKRDRRNTSAGETSEGSSDSDDSMEEDVGGRDAHPHENTNLDSINLVKGLVRPPADEEAPSSSPASANFELHLTESPNETSVVEGSQDPFRATKNRTEGVVVTAPWLNNVISAFGHGVSGARRDASSFGRSEDLETQKNSPPNETVTQKTICLQCPDTI